MANYIKLTATNSGALNYNLADNPDLFQFLNIERIVLVCDSTLNPINIQLPKITDLAGFTNYEVLVNDNSGTAGSHAITITVGDSATDNILGNAGIALNKDYYKMHFYVASNNTAANAWEVQVSSCCTNTYVEQVSPGVTGTTLATTHVINTDEPVVVVKTQDPVFGQVLIPGVDYTITGGSTTSTINFTTPLDAATIMVQYSYTDLIAP